MKGRKQEKPLKLDISFDDALCRLIRTSPADLAESIEVEKRAKGSVEKTDPENAEKGQVERSG